MPLKRFSKLNIKSFVRFESKKIINAVIQEYEKDIVNVIRRKVRTYLENDPTVGALIFGELTPEFGLVDPYIKVRSFIDYVVRSIRLERTAVTRSLTKKGSNIRVTIPLDFTNAINRPWANQKNIQRGKNANPNATNSLPWLKWLILDGRGVIVRGYNISYNDIGRSGFPGVMRKSQRGWRVPRRYAGTQNNNFVTRLLKQNQGDIEKTMRDYLVIQLRKVSTRRRR